MKGSLTSLFAASAVLLFLSPPELPAQEEAGATPPEEITVMSYNIRVGMWHTHTGEYESMEENLQGIVDIIEEAGTDIVLFQEVDNGARRTDELDQAKWLGEALGFHYHYAPAIEFQGGEYGVSMASRWPIIEAETVKLFNPDYAETHPEWGLDAGRYHEQRVVQVATIDMDGQPVTVMNTHLGLSQHQRQIQIAQMAAIVEEHLLLPQGAVILGGDINAEPDAIEIKPLRERLRDTYLMIRDQRGVPHNIPFRDRMTFRSDDPRTCIDYIFVSDRFDVLATEVLDVTASDHRPVVTRLRVLD